LQIQDGLLWFKGDGISVPVVPFHFLVEIALQVHWQLGHVGRNKLIEALKGEIWHPSRSVVAADICNSCPQCQQYKTSSQQVTPPILKIERKRPFDMIAADLVQLPKTRTGYIGALVVVDHCSKWLAVAPLRSKTSTAVEVYFKDKFCHTCLLHHVKY
jgi:hypothetical protein